MWKEIVRAALLGTDHTALPDETLRRLSELGVDAGAEPAEVLLTAAAVVAPMRRAGFLTPDFAGALPPPAPTDARPVCGDAAAACLTGILWGKYRACLPEFMNYCRRFGKKLPPEMVPRLLNISLYDDAWLTFFAPVLGEQEQWLLRQNPEWKPLIKKIAALTTSAAVETPSAVSVKDALATARRLAQVRELSKLFIQPAPPSQGEFQLFAHECPPEAFEQAAEMFGKIEDRNSFNWAEQALDVLYFRKQMNAAFETGES